MTPQIIILNKLFKFTTKVSKYLYLKLVSLKEINVKIKLKIPDYNL
jgi:hypothetical protein